MPGLCQLQTLNPWLILPMNAYGSCVHMPAGVASAAPAPQEMTQHLWLHTCCVWLFVLPVALCDSSGSLQLRNIAMTQVLTSDASCVCRLMAGVTHLCLD